MIVIAILALALVLAIVWRLARFAAKLVLLGALIVLIAKHSTSATTRHRAGAPTRSAAPGSPRRPSGARVTSRLTRRSEGLLTQTTAGRK